MDCRKPLALVGLSLLAAAPGCSTHSAAVPARSSATAAASKPDGLDPEALKRPPKPETFVAFGDFSAREAEATKAPAERDQLRARARYAYQEALKIDPKNLPAQRALARLYAAANDTEHARALFEAVLSAAPEDAAVWFDLGMTYARAKEWAPAVDHLQRAVELSPENRSYARFLGFTLARAGRYDESLAAFSRGEGEAKAHYYLAEMLEHVGNQDLCKAHLQEALAKDPQMADAAQMLARVSGVAAGPGAAPTPASGVQPVGYAEEALPVPPAPQRRILPPPPSLPAGVSGGSAAGGEGR